jgi:hypothetical protein
MSNSVAASRFYSLIGRFAYVERLPRQAVNQFALLRHKQRARKRLRGKCGA